jgi:hypothetical protein
VPEAYREPNVWYCQSGDCRQSNGSHFLARLRQPGECINCSPPRAAQPTT